MKKETETETKGNQHELYKLIPSVENDKKLRDIAVISASSTKQLYLHYIMFLRVETTI